MGEKNCFAHGRFPKVGQKQKTEEKERKRESLSEKCHTLYLCLCLYLCACAFTYACACRIEGLFWSSNSEFHISIYLSVSLHEMIKIWIFSDLCLHPDMNIDIIMTHIFTRVCTDKVVHHIICYDISYHYFCIYKLV